MQSFKINLACLYHDYVANTMVSFKISKSIELDLCTVF